MERAPTVYILASGRHGTLYVGVTSNLLKRLHEHRAGLIKGFTSRYGVNRLVYFERFDEMTPAITREKQIKKWLRDWKVNLIEAENPGWVDLAPGMGFGPTSSAGGYGSPPSRGRRKCGDDEVGTMTRKP